MRGTYSAPNSFLSGGGGLVSTLVDYIKFIQLIVNGGEWQDTGLLKPETLDLMRSSQLAEGFLWHSQCGQCPVRKFGLGFALKDEVGGNEPAGMKGEYHWGGMAGTHSWMSPDTGITGMCMTQRMPGFWHAFSHDFKALVYQAAEQAAKVITGDIDLDKLVDDIDQQIGVSAIAADNAILNEQLRLLHAARSTIQPITGNYAAKRANRPGR